MIMFYYGDNVDSRTKAVHSQIDTLVSHNTNTSIARFDETNWSEHTILSYTESSGLFDSTYIIVFDRVFEDSSKLDFLLKNIEIFNSSSNYFIFIENKVTKEVLKKIETTNSIVENFPLEKKIKAKTADAFAIANAFGQKDKKNTWFLYIQHIEKGESPEAISGMLFWKIKTMISSRKVSPYTKEELIQISSDLVSVYHEARLSGFDLTISLERFILRSL